MLPVILPLLIHAASADDVDDAVRLLSHYPPGLVPVEAGSMSAVATVASQGTRAELPMLRDLAGRERPEVQSAALTAIDHIRTRARDDGRAGFADGLPDWAELASAAKPFRVAGVGREESLCAAYASLVLPDVDPWEGVAAAHGDPGRLLTEARPRSALAASRRMGTAGLRFEAVAREDLGDVTGAVRVWAELASTGDPDARAELDRFGVDAERLLLGMLVVHPPATEAEVLEVLVRHGTDLTVAVLTERTRSTLPSDRATAADALARMLDPRLRGEALRADAEHQARRALAVASSDGPEPIRVIAREGMGRYP